MKNIYELELNETTFLNVLASENYTSSTAVTRVPGGWIYRTKTSMLSENSTALANSAVFVPYCDEFNKKPR